MISEILTVVFSGLILVELQGRSRSESTVYDFISYDPIIFWTIRSFLFRSDRFLSFCFWMFCVNILMNTNQDLEGLGVWWLGLFFRETMLNSSLLTIHSSPPTTWYHYCSPFCIAMDRVALSQWFGRSYNLSRPIVNMGPFYGLETVLFSLLRIWVLRFFA